MGEGGAQHHCQDSLVGCSRRQSEAISPPLSFITGAIHGSTMFEQQTARKREREKEGKEKKS